jgi:hypothetical protein
MFLHWVFIKEHNSLTHLLLVHAPKMTSSFAEKKESHILVNMLHIISTFLRLYEGKSIIIRNTTINFISIKI